MYENISMHPARRLTASLKGSEGGLPHGKRVREVSDGVEILDNMY
jgi:hypothetical protein